MTEVRRSNRVRQPTTSIYDDAKRAQEESTRRKQSQQKQSQDADHDDEKEHDEMQEDESSVASQSTSSNHRMAADDEHGATDDENDSNAMESDVTDTDEVPSDPEYNTSHAPRKSPPKSRRSPNGGKSIRSSKAPSRSSTKGGTGRSRAASSRPAVFSQVKSVQSALQSLSKNVLVVEELKDPSKSLVASLLVRAPLSCSLKTKKAGNEREDVEDYLSRSTSCYTDALFGIARDVVALYNAEPNRAQVRLVNLLFRSVGGTQNSDLDEDKVQLEEMGNDEWGDIVTDLVDDMRFTPENCVLFCTDPDGAVHYNAVMNSVKDDVKDGAKVCERSIRDIPVTVSSLGVREYRKIYEEFWYVLGHVALVEGGMSGSASVVPFQVNEIDASPESGDDDDDNDGQEATTNRRQPSKSPKVGNGTVTTRYDTEVARDILSRIVELVSVGQPDIRAAASAAVYAMGQAILDKTVRLSEKLQIVTRQFAAAVGGKGKKASSAKAESLTFQIDCLRRTRDALDEMIEALVIKGVFIHRYRDSNMFVRAMSIQALADMVVRRPDVFLKDKYLKYFGWMLSDKSECVRIAALEALNRPFEDVENAKKIGKDSPIDLSHLEHVTAKFLKRISDTAIDVHTSVQERGMKLMLSLLRAGFLDDVDDEKMWNQVNLLAFETASTPSVRRDALYFIMEQLEEFDDGVDEGNESAKKRKSIGDSPTSDRKAAQRLDAIASWAAHTLTDGKVPLEKIQIDLVDHLVNSLRDMPDHKDIVTNWNAIIRAITDEKIATTSQGNAAGARADLAKQRVLVQMLICAAKAEVEAVTEYDFLLSDLDPVLYIDQGKGSRRNVTTKCLNHESLSVALIKAVPNLLEKFKSDSKILESLTLLPRYFAQSVFTLPQRKNDFIALLNVLREVFLLSTDERVLRNSARSINYLSEGNHARSNDAKNGVRKLVMKIRDLILLHSSEDTKEKKSRRGSTTRDDDRMKFEKETALYLCLMRARILSWMGIFSENLDDDVKPDATEELFNAVADALTHRLGSFNITLPCNDEGETMKVQTWNSMESQLSNLTAGTIDEGLQFLLSVTAHRLYVTQHEENLILNGQRDTMSDKDENHDVDDDHMVSRFQHRLISLVENCFQHYLDHDTKGKCSAEQINWSNSVQKSAGDIASDLRTLFPREWSDASSARLRSFAITDDSRLIGGYVRYLHGVEEEKGNDDNHESLHPILLSIGRAVVANWKLGNRREAGVLLSHISNSNTETSDMIKTLSRLLRSIQPVRFLEAQMASLRQSYENWIDSDPADIDDENPTDEMMANFEIEEMKHKKLFENIVEQANLFSETLGLKSKRRLTDSTLATALVGFVKEGIRFSFSNSEEFMLGSRLSFLSVLVSYAKHVKMYPEHNRIISEYIHEMESDLRSHEDFEEVHEDDLAALAEFRKALGLGESKIIRGDASTTENEGSFRSSMTQRSTVTPNSRAESATTAGHDYTQTSNSTVNDLSLYTPATSAARKSRVSSAGSIRSAMSSVQGSLSPLYEEGNEEESGESETSTPGAGSKRSLFEGSTKSRHSGYDSSVISKRSRFDNSAFSKESEYESTVDEQLIYSKSQTTLEVDQSDLESPHR